MAAQFILHHYDASPFSEKVRVMFGLKGMAWSSVQTPNMMPKPDLVPLTGGYRRAPVMQIGADIYCDSQVILAEIERRAPQPAAIHGDDWALNLWADRLFFQATVPIIFAEVGHMTPKAFLDDREKLSGRPFDIEAMKRVAGPLQGQWRAQAGWLEQGLEGRAFLAGDRPGLADVAAYMNVWWLSRALPQTAARLLAGFRHVDAWRQRMADLGHGDRREMSGGEALEIARAAEPAPPPPHDGADPLGLEPGAEVQIMADDYGRDPIPGRLVAANANEVVIARAAEGLGTLHIHFPRAGYIAAPAT